MTRKELNEKQYEEVSIKEGDRIAKAMANADHNNIICKILSTKELDNIHYEEVKRKELELALISITNKYQKGPELMHISKNITQIMLSLKYNTHIEFEDLVNKANHEVSVFQKLIKEKLSKFENEFDSEQLEEIRLGLVDNLDISYYTDPMYNSFQMKEIRKGLKENINISLYADPKYDWRQMRIIRMGLEYNLNVFKYAKPEYNWKQMRQIFEMLDNTTPIFKGEYIDCDELSETELKSILGIC